MILDFRTLYLFNIFTDISPYIQNYPLKICITGPMYSPAPTWVDPKTSVYMGHPRSRIRVQG